MKFHWCFIALILWGCEQHPPNVGGETLVIERRPVNLVADRYNVAFLIMDGVYNTELTAPYDIFQHTIFRDSIKAMNTFMVANTHEPIITFEGIRLLPDYNYLKDDLPQIDILVVPSAEHHLDTDLQDTAMIAFVQKVDREATFVTSHCDGAFVLAKAGLLDSVASTTFPTDIDAFREMFPHLEVHDNVLFVHDGKYITSAGGAKSFEASLYLCEWLYGESIAQRLAKGLVINWDLKRVPHYIAGKKTATLTHQNLSKVPPSILRNKGISELVIGNEEFNAYPPISMIPSNMIALDELPEELCSLNELTRLTVTATQIESIPSCLANLNQLSYLNLSLNPKLKEENALEVLLQLPNLDTLVLWGGLKNQKMVNRLNEMKPALVVKYAPEAIQL